MERHGTYVSEYECIPNTLYELNLSLSVIFYLREESVANRDVRSQILALLRKLLN